MTLHKEDTFGGSHSNKLPLGNVVEALDYHKASKERRRKKGDLVLSRGDDVLKI